MSITGNGERISVRDAHRDVMLKREERQESNGLVLGMIDYSFDESSSSHL